MFFFDVSKELWGNRSALFGVVVLATCSLYIFSVRLAISHDLAYWNLFFLLALSGFVWWQKTKSRQSVLFMGLMCGALALVKFSGILLFIWLGLWLLHDALNSGRLKNLGWFLFIDLMLYVPVGFYNLAAFLSTGYVDVPTAIVLKKLGLPAKSLMSGAMYDGATDTAVKASLDLISTITDMTNPVFVAAFITSLIFVVLNRNKWALSFFGLIGLYCLFFVLVGFRAYYLSFFSILMVFVITSAASKVSATLQAVLLVFLIITSGRYSYNTFYTQDLPVEHQGEYGRSLEYIPKISLSRKNSLAIRSWLHNTGTKSFANWIKNTNSESYVYSSDISLEELRWYGKLDPVRAKLSENYRDEFELYKIDGFDLCNQEYLLVANKDKAYRVCGKQMVPLEESETTALFSQ